MPHIEQENAYRRARLATNQEYNSGVVRSGIGDSAGRPNFSVYRCPASPLTRTHSISPPYSMVADYVGVAGTVNNFGGNGATGHRTTAYGPTAFNGVLHYNSKVTLVGIIDGTSNTIMVGECGQWVFTGSTRRDYRPSVQHGFAMGCRGNGNNSTSLSYNSNARVFNTTTLRRRINQITGYGTGCGDGVCQNAGNNTPLRSNHSGGVNVLLADGSCHFLSDSTATGVLGRMGARDDGRPVNFQ